MMLPGMQNPTDNPNVISGRKLIFIIGLLGFVLPIALILISVSFQDCEVVQDSISAYYYTIARNVFVGTLCALALCLAVYNGYSKFDYWLSNTASFFALGVAFFPTSVLKNSCIDVAVGSSIISTIHFVSAAFLFITFAIFSLFLFTKTNKELSSKKKRENLIYTICGWLIVVSITLIFIWSVFFDEGDAPSIASLRPVFWLESIALWSFSISWLTKSKIFTAE